MLRQTHLESEAESGFENSRRTSLKQMAAFLGLSLTADSIAVLAQTPEKKKPRFLSAADLFLTGQLAELIIPTTETPGALAAEVHIFIDQYLVECKSEEDRQAFLKGLARINQLSKQNFQKEFVKLTQAQQTQLLTAIEQHQLGFDASDDQRFKQLKTLVIFGYYTSEIGASQELAYLAIPGGYKGNVPFAKIGKAWALNN